jgi:hypothetical protein
LNSWVRARMHVRARNADCRQRLRQRSRSRL